MMHNFLKLSSLVDIKYDKDAKYLINRHSALIFHNPYFYPEAFRAVLRDKIGDVIIKGDKKRVLSRLKDIFYIKYPYILIKEENAKEFLACKIDSCFYNTKDFGKLKEKIESILAPQKPEKWDKKVSLNER